MKNLLRDVNGLYGDISRVYKNHWKATIFISVTSTILTFAPMIINKIWEAIDERKTQKLIEEVKHKSEP